MDLRKVVRLFKLGLKDMAKTLLTNSHKIKTFIQLYTRFLFSPFGHQDASCLVMLSGD